MKGTNGLSTMAGEIIGYRRNGAPIRLAAGGSEDTDGTGTDTTGRGGIVLKGEVDPARLTASLEAARAAEAKAIAAVRAAKAEKEAAEKAAAERIAAILKAAGQDAGDDKPDPEKVVQALTGERDTATATARELAAENAILRGAAAAGGDPVAMSDSLSVRAAVAKLDPAADDYAEALAKALKAALKANPSLAARTTSTTRLGVDHSGSGGNEKRATSMAGAITAAMGG